MKSKQANALRVPYSCHFISFALGIAALLFLYFSSGVTFAAIAPTAPSPPTASKLTVSLNAGLDTAIRPGGWSPVQVTISNQGMTFHGMLKARIFYTFQRQTVVLPQHYDDPVTVPHGKQVQVTLYLPFSMAPSNIHGVQVDLLDSHGQVVNTQDQQVYTLAPANVFVGILTDRNSSLGPLNNATLPIQSNEVVVSLLDASTFPTLSAVLDNFDVIVLADFDTRSLSAEQFTALYTWVNHGGVLIEIGGQGWQRTLKMLPKNLLPVTLQSITTLPAHTQLLPTTPSDHSMPIPFVLPASQATLNTLSTSVVGVLSLRVGTLPLLVQQPLGQGKLCYLAVDPLREPLLSWSGTADFWGRLLLRTLGNTLLISGSDPYFLSGPGDLYTRGGILSMLFPDVAVTPWLLLVLIICYALLLGPGRIWLVRRFKHPSWSWRIILVGILLFSLLSYGLAFYLHSSSLITNSISLLRLDQDGSSAAITTYIGMFTPNAGNFQLREPATNVKGLLQPVPNVVQTGLQLSDDSLATIAYRQGGTTANLSGIGPWTFHAFVLSQDRQLPGRLLPHLTLNNGLLIGTINNTLTTGLSDVYVLLPSGIVSLGHIAAGEVLQVNTPVVSGKGSLASQIAHAQGLEANYFPYAHNGQAQTATQRHVALLSALSDLGYSFPPCEGSCTQRSILHDGNIITPRSGYPIVSLAHNDPLLATQAPATLLAWTDQPVDGSNSILVNGEHAAGYHDNLLQMPLNLPVTATSHLMPDIITGQITSVQGYSITMTTPDTYSVGTGSGMTMEFTLPYTLAAHARQLTFTLPQALYPPLTLSGNKGNSGLLNRHIQALQVQVYNWQTTTWQTITLQDQSMTLLRSSAFVSTDNHIVLRLIDQNSTPGLLYIGRPMLAIT